MKIAITGTPGTGKTSVASLMEGELTVIHVNSLIMDGYNLGRDESRGGSYIADIDRLAEYVDSIKGDVLLEGHISHLLPVDMVIVLRTAPRKLKERLASRGWSEEKLRENVEAEALDVILVESLEANDKVYEIDTTNMTTMQVKEAVIEIIKGTDKYAPGSIDFSEDVFL